MSFVEIALNRIHREIPEIILNQAFGVTIWEYQNMRVSLDSRIRLEIFEKIVLPDCNIVGGEIMTVSLLYCNWEWLESGIRITVPLSLTRNRNISSVLSVEEVNRMMEPYQVTEGKPGSTGTAEVYLVAPNTIFLPINLVNKNANLRCTIENDPNLLNYSQKAMYEISELAVRAAKGYIYNKLVIGVTVTANNGGNIDGRIREIIDSYSDSWELYREFLTTKFKKITLMDNREWHNRLIKLGMGG